MQKKPRIPFFYIFGMEIEKQTVAVGLSGGVDSSLAAWTLKQQGYNAALELQRRALERISQSAAEAGERAARIAEINRNE